MTKKSYKIGIIGTGFISRGFILSLNLHQDLIPSRVLTRRRINECSDFPRQDLLTNSLWELIDNSDLIVECSGDVIHATESINQIFAASLPVVTMDAELQVTTGSYLAHRGLLTEAEGDQPGCLAALRENCIQMGFRPIVYGNIKVFLNVTPTLSEMEFWSRKQGISLAQVTSFTDGTKVQIEQVLVANAFNATIMQQGLLGPAVEDVTSGGKLLANYAKAKGQIISDYILSPKAPRGVFIVAEHDEQQQSYLRYYGIGEGPFYTIVQNHHLCHLEIAKTIRRILGEKRILLNNSEQPRFSVAAVAKKDILKGSMVQRAIGSFEFRGESIWIKDNPDHIPIGLLANAVTTERIEKGKIVTFSDVEIRDSFALQAWKNIKKQ